MFYEGRGVGTGSPIVAEGFPPAGWGEMPKTQRYTTQEVPESYKIHKVSPQGYRSGKDFQREKTLWAADLPANCAESYGEGALVSHLHWGGSLTQVP